MFGRPTSPRAKVKLGTKPRVLFGTLLGTLSCFVLFIRHYGNIRDESAVNVWFGMRSDGRCGRDFGSDSRVFGSAETTTCGKGACCSSHGWCGHGEEYRSVAMGCQNNCWPASKEDEAKRDADERERHRHSDPDDDEYMDRMHDYRYDDHDDHHGDYYRRRYGHDYHDEYGHGYHQHHRYGS